MELGTLKRGANPTHPTISAPSVLVSRRKNMKALAIIISALSLSIAAPVHAKDQSSQGFHWTQTYQTDKGDQRRPRLDKGDQRRFPDWMVKIINVIQGK